MGRVECGGSGGPDGPSGGAPIQASLVIRVWRDTESPEPFRARIIAGSAEGNEPTVAYARGRAEVVAAVNRWLDDLPDD
ncbi:hypothetical protein ACVWZ7_000555 [Arthrobacter sp. TE12232]